MIQKFDNPWASSGDTGTAPTTEKQNNGFVRREKPIRQLFNWLFNKQQEKANELIDWVSNVAETATDREFEIASGLHSETWASVYGDKCLFDAGSGTTIDAIGCCFIDGVSHVLALDTTGNEIHAINSKTGTVAYSSGDLTATITGSSVQALNFCTDNDSVYVIFSTSTVPILGKFTIPGFGYDSVWPSGGIAMAGTWTDNGRPGIKIVNDSKFAVACPWVTITSSGSEAIQVFYSDTGNVSSVGAGDATTGNSEYATGEIGSDGTNIYWGTAGGSSPTHERCSATIDDASTGVGIYTGFPESDTNTWRVCGAGNFAVYARDITAPVDNDDIIAISRSTHSEFDVMKSGTADSGADPQNTHWAGCQSVIFDGINVWFGIQILKNVTGTYQTAVVGIDLSNFRSAATMFPADMTSFIKGPFYLGAVGTGLHGHYLATDGRDIFGADGSRYIDRLPMSIRR